MSDYKFFQDNTDIGMFALTVGMATNPLGAAMLGYDLGNRLGAYISYLDQKGLDEAAARYERERGEKDRYQQAEAQKTAQKYYSRNQASAEMAEIRRLANPIELLKEEDIKRNKEDQFINQQIGQYNLGSYRNQYQQNMIMNNRNLQLSRQKAIMDQTAQKLSGLKAQTAAAQADAAEKAAVAQQQREAYMTAIATKKDTMDQQARTYQDNLARSQNTLNLQQNIIQQNELANQRAQEQAAAVAASRALPTPSNKPRPPPRRLPPPVALPKY